MVIRVEVRPSQPRRRRHSAEHGMEVPVEAVAPIGRDLPEQLFKLCDVRVEVRGSGATSVLIEFGSGKNASRPSDGCVQGDPSHHESRKRRRSELRCPVAGQQAAPVAQVAHHLVRRHASPAACAILAKRSQTAEDLRRVTFARQRPHRGLARGLSARGDARRQPLEMPPARAGVPLRHQRAASGIPGHRAAHQIAANR